MKSKNTHKNVTATVFVFLNAKEKKYVGVCLELDIVETDKDKVVLAKRMKEHVQAYVEYVCTKKLDENLLNRPAPDEYWKMFFRYVHSLQELQNIPSRRVFEQAPEATVETFELVPARA